MAGLKVAVTQGRLEGLRALRDALATEIEGGGNVAPAAAQLRVVLADIEALEKSVRKGSVVDELDERRKARSSGTAGGLPPTGSGGKPRS